ncbi:MAG: glycosyltransferase, partial [Candidatus Dormibacteraeota bacterium]|nr:glycosyltransferase [Candidatus Dormibacteraeota bacterium]
MVRVLATCQPGTGHLHPLAPVLRAFESAGHDVVVATAGGFTDEVRRLGFHHAAVGLDWRVDRLPEAFPGLNQFSNESERIRYLIERVFAGACAEATAVQLKDIFSRWRPDLLIHEPSEFGGPLAAEAAGIPVITHGIGRPANAFGAAELTAAALAPLRRRLGLPQRIPHPSVYLDPCPPSFHNSPLPNWLPVLPVRPEAIPGGVPSPWIDARSRPFIYLTMGTTIARERMLRSALAGLSGLGGTVVATLGSGVGVAALDEGRPNVRLADFVPDGVVLPQADLVVCHGGWSSTVAALAHGVPLVLLPVGSDQPWNAQHCRALGVGRVLDLTERNPDAIRDAAAAVLADPIYR